MIVEKVLRLAAAVHEAGHAPEVVVIGDVRALRDAAALLSAALRPATSLWEPIGELGVEVAVEGRVGAVAAERFQFVARLVGRELRFRARARELVDREQRAGGGQERRKKLALAELGAELLAGDLSGIEKNQEKFIKILNNKEKFGLDNVRLTI